MARQILAQLILQLKDELSGRAKGAANSLRDVERAAAALNKSSGKGLEVLGNQLDRATREAQEFARAMGATPKWGASFQNQIDRLRLSVGEMERLKRSWAAVSAEMAASSDQAFRSQLVRRWRNESLASIMAVRAAQEELSREASAAEKKRIADTKKAEAQLARDREAQAKAEARAKEAAAREAARAVRDTERAAAREQARLADEEARRLKAADAAARRAVSEAATAEAKAHARAAADRAKADAKAAAERARAEKKALDESVKAQRRAEAEKTRIAAREAAERARIAKQEAREAERAQRDAIRAASEARKRDGRDAVRYARAVAREISYAAGLGAGTYLVARGARAVGAESAGNVREGERQLNAGVTPDESLRLRGKAYQLSAKYPSLSPLDIQETGRQLVTNVGSPDRAIELLEPYIRARAAIKTAAGPDADSGEMESFARFIDIIGKSMSVDDTLKLIDGYVRARQVDPAAVSASDYVQMAKTAAAPGKGFSTDFWARVAPAIMMQQGGFRSGTDLATAYQNTVIGRGTKESRAAQTEFGVRTKDGLVDEALYSANPFEWMMKNLVPKLQEMGALPQDLNQDLTDQQRATINKTVSEMFSNRRGANIFSMMLQDIDQFHAIMTRLGKAEGLAAVERTQQNDPFVAFDGMVTQMRSLLAVLGEPAMREVAPILHGWSTAIADFAAQLKEADAGLGLLGMGGVAAGAVGAGYVGYKALKHFTGAAALEGAAAALTGSAQALSSAAAQMSGGSVDVPGGKDGKKKRGKGGALGLAAVGLSIAAAWLGADRDALGDSVEKGLSEGQKKGEEWRRLIYGDGNGRGDRQGPAGAGSPANTRVLRPGLTEAEKGAPPAGTPGVSVPRPASPDIAEAGRDATEVASRIDAAFAAAETAAQQGGQAAGANFASATAASLAANGATIVAAAQGIMAQIRAIFAGGASVRVSPTGASPAAGAAAARGDVAPVARAGGGSVYPGVSYLVGEHGMERFTPGVAGRVDPIGRGGGVTFQNTFHIHGGGEEAAQRIVAEMKRQFQREADGLFADYGMDTA